MSTTYTIYAHKREEVEKRLQAIARRVAKFGAVFSYTIGEEYAQKIAPRVYDPAAGCLVRVAPVVVSCIDIVLDDALLKREGWQVLGRVDHGTDADGAPFNLIDNFTGASLEEYRRASCTCDHCRTKRARAYTYIVENASGARLQVGRACLKEYAGIDPAAAVAWARIREELTACSIHGNTDGAQLKSARVFSVADVLGLAYDITQKYGYVAADHADSTKQRVIDALLKGIEASEEGKKAAVDIAAYIRNYPYNYGIEADARALLIRDYCKIKHVGRLAYMPRAYAEYIRRKEEERARAEEAARSAHIYGVGERVNITIDGGQLVTSFQTIYGDMRIYRFTAAGNVYIWKTSGSIDPRDLITGATIRGTVKALTEYRNEKQTELSRVKISAPEA